MYNTGFLFLKMHYDVFISYSRKDTRMADRICAAFDRNGISYFIDRKGISAGVEFPEVIAEAIEASSFFLFLGSVHSYASKYALNEVAYAFNEMPRNSVIPYLIDDAPLPKNLKFLFSGVNIRNYKEHSVEEVLTKDILGLLNVDDPVTETDVQKTTRTGPKASWKSFIQRIREANPLVIVFAILQLALFILLYKDFFPLFLKGYASKPPHHTVWWCNVALTTCFILSFVGTLGILAGKKSCFFAVCALDVVEFIFISVISRSIFNKAIALGRGNFSTATYETLRVLGGWMDEPWYLLLILALLAAHAALMWGVLRLKKNGISAWSTLQ